MRDAAPWWRPDPGAVLRIEGGRVLTGRWRLGGAKNAVLPLMVAALLTPHLVTLRRVPAILDVAVLAGLLRRLGAGLSWSRDAAGLTLTIAADTLHPADVDAELVARMRASVLLLGALLARCGQARLPMPGGDAIGLRGVDFHLAGLRAMGATIEVAGGVIDARAPHGLHGAAIDLPMPSVGATENLLIAAVLARGTTIIRNAAREPEITDLARCLAAMGATIEGAGSPVLTVQGDRPLLGAQHAVLPDRIEMGTMACAAALTDGDLVLEGADAALLGAAAPLLAEAGVALDVAPGGLRACRAPGGLRGVDFRTAPFPGVATDLQSPLMALLAVAPGASAITETIFEQRFRHVDELRRMGADISLRGTTAWLRGVPHLSGAPVAGTDVRAAAALLLAGLGAQGVTELRGLDHLDRGHEAMVERLQACGAGVERR
ncbi:UDP-N-acetylglucosamine 1-carboxyvinyltransferase [Roseomonas sp. HJA6]|uniref:UDP-N-acetylglucosamine 1-carboxyvinyltransferase n=1 Tax=Roseomonas alba TaxID=2846776 RepID=A0ABS7ABL2_9PROT|nr:UDP-N-acetylglucosamine 1-carboxyvinyltransferase [Neoroseomonas alba]MBW6398569.1 UDP-N-acetylglucosamine 1-carboxyvinyltransferase [Neoroseomonas alba]